jgi:hypothetical protein
MEMVTVLMLETPFLVAVGMGGPVICVNKVTSLLLLLLIMDDFTSTVLDINECNQDVCKNGGKCINYLGGYQCECAPGYSGTNCESGNNPYSILNHGMLTMA